MHLYRIKIWNIVVIGLQVHLNKPEDGQNVRLGKSL